MLRSHSRGHLRAVLYVRNFVDSFLNGICGEFGEIKDTSDVSSKTKPSQNLCKDCARIILLKSAMIAGQNSSIV